MAKLRDTHVAFIGGGVANTAAITTLIDKLEANQISKEAASRIHLYVYDNRASFIGRGSGWAAHPALMINTRIFPEGDFYEWLVKNKNRWLEYLRSGDEDNTLGLTDSGNAEYRERWYPKHKSEINGNDFESAFVPRRVAGFYMQDMLYRTLEKAKKLGVDIQLIEGDVQTLVNGINGKNYHIWLRHPGRTMSMQPLEKNGLVYGYDLKPAGIAPAKHLEANTVVLGMGGARQKPLDPPVERHAAYMPSLRMIETTPYKEFRQKIDAAYAKLNPDPAKPPQKVQIAALGGNTSFLDLCMLMNHYPETRKKVEITSISRTKKPLAAYSRAPRGYVYKPLLNIDDFAKGDRRLQSTDGLVKLLDQEMQHAFQGQPLYDLPLAEEHFFYEFLKKGIQQGKVEEKLVKDFFDRAPYDRVNGLLRDWKYITDTYHGLEQDGVVKRHYASIENVQVAGKQLRVITRDSETKRVEKTTYDFVVNCQGFLKSYESNTPFLRGMIFTGLVTPNASERGIIVDDNREVLSKQTKKGPQKDLFAVGDLVTGNLFSKGNNYRKRVAETGDTIVDRYRRYSLLFNSMDDGKIVGEQIAERLYQTHEKPVPKVEGGNVVRDGQDRSIAR